MKNWITQNGYIISLVLSVRSNVYLIQKGKQIILVDTGMTRSFNRLSSNIKSMNIRLKDISLLILTHTHFDHCQSAKKIKKESNCRIIVSGNAVESIKNGYTKIPKATFFVTRLISGLGSLTGEKILGYQPFQADKFVHGELDLNIEGVNLKIIETSGHSADSVCILIDNEFVITGDEMFGVFKNSIFPPFSDDVIKMIKNWRILLNTECKTFLPGHGGEICRNLVEKEYKKYARKYKVI